MCEWGTTNMRIVLLTIAFLLALFLSSKTYAEDFNRYSGRSYGTRAHVHHHDGDRRMSRRSEPIFTPNSESSSCFPYGCGGISGPLTNPNPDARKPENLTACLYDATGTLLYERENKVCPYKYIDENQSRVEVRRQEWLRQQRK